MRRRGLTLRLSYANVVGTLALFIALGGASYAATSLPAGSVGTRQLAFPLGALSSTAYFTQSLHVESCSGDQPCPPPTLETKPFRSLSVTLTHPAKLLILASASLLESSPIAAPVLVNLWAERSDALAGSTSGEVGAESSNLEFWQILSAPSGHEVIQLQASAQSDGSTARTVLVNSAQLGVVVLPGLK